MSSQLLERLEQVVPGFRGYRDPELAEEDEALVRRRVLEILDEARARVERLIVIMKKRSVGAALRLDDLRLELMKAAQMLRQVERGSPAAEGRAWLRGDVVAELLRRDYELVSAALRVMERVVGLSMMVEGKEFMDRLNETIDIVYGLEDTIRKREALLRR